MKIRLDPVLCKKCGLCEIFCPKKVFGPKGKIINLDQCSECGICLLMCPERALALAEASMAPEKTLPGNKKRGGWQVKKPLLAPGYYFLSGNEACAQAALDSGCRFYAGYPITPASEIMYGMLKLKEIAGGVFIQMEDEIGSVAAIIGASWTGKKTMTATSGPGFSLMQENIGFAVITETPCVIINAQRTGPSTGQPTRPASGDLMQAIWGTHGDSPKIVLAPSSVQECYNLTIEAFNLAEQFRTPVIVLLEENIAHLKAKVEIPAELKIYERKYAPGENPFGSGAKYKTPSMPRLGEGENLSITGATHRPSGKRAATSSTAQKEMTGHFTKKMKAAEKPLLDIKVCSGDEIIVISYGSAANSVDRAIKESPGKKIGHIVIKKIWPFPFETLKEIKQNAAGTIRVIVPEMNQGQLIQLVRQIFPEAESLTQSDSMPIEPQTILKHFRGKPNERSKMA